MLSRKGKRVKNSFRVEISELYPGRPITFGQKIRLQKVLEAEVARIYEEMELKTTVQRYSGEIYRLERRIKILEYVSVIVGALLVSTLIFKYFLI